MSMLVLIMVSDSLPIKSVPSIEAPLNVKVPVEICIPFKYKLYILFFQEKQSLFNIPRFISLVEV